MKSLRGRLFAAILAALALTLILTIAIGAVLTRQQVGHAQVVALARQADNLAPSRRQSVSYVNSNTVDGGIRTVVDTRPDLAPYVPNTDQVVERHDDLRRQALPVLVPDDPGARAPAAPSGELEVGGVASVPRRPAARRARGRRPGCRALVRRRPLDRAAGAASRRREPCPCGR